MKYTLMPGDPVIVDTMAYGIRIPLTKVDFVNVSKPQVGEVAVSDSPENSTLLIQRIVAESGDPR